MARNTKKFHLILDFDGTIIKNNTIPLLDYLRQDQNDISYGSFLDPYLRDYTEHIKNYQPSQEKRVTLQQEYDYLDSLGSVEKRSIERIESSGWLKGLKWTPEENSAFDTAVSHIGHNETLVWRTSFADLVKTIWQSHGMVDILSVNWSGNFIRALLRHEFGGAIDIDRIGLYSNEIDPSGTGRFSRVKWKSQDHFVNHWLRDSDHEDEDSRGIWTAQDKALVMRAVTATSKANNMITIYVGDSKTDLRSIMEADIGVCIEDNIDPTAEQVSLKEVFDRLAIDRIPIGNSLYVGEKRSKDQDQLVYHAQDFNEVRKALLGCTE